MAIGGSAAAAGGMMKSSMAEMVPMMIQTAQMQIELTMIQSVLNLERSEAAGVEKMSTTPQ